MLTENLNSVTTKDAVQIAIWEVFDNEKSHQLSIVNAHKGQNIF